MPTDLKVVRPGVVWVTPAEAALWWLEQLRPEVREDVMFAYSEETTPDQRRAVRKRLRSAVSRL
jgi:hypothetical protein